MDRKFPRKIERRLVQILCDNLREHPQEWDHQSDRSNHQDDIQIWTDSDFWKSNPIYMPERVSLGRLNKYKLWQAIKASKNKINPPNSNSLADWIETTAAARSIANLSSKANDPIIKYRERFGQEPTKELIKLAENGKLITDDQE